MTKGRYLELCEELGSEPLDSELPVDLDDMPVEVEQAYHVYGILPANFDSFNGVYYGKYLEQAPTIMDLMGAKPKQEIMKVLIIIDSIEREEINRKRKDGSRQNSKG
jgi:hypothetical protein